MFFLVGDNRDGLYLNEQIFVEQAVHLHITQENLASLLAVSRQSISKQIKALEREGIVTLSYSRITLTDYGNLARLFGPSQ